MGVFGNGVCDWLAPRGIVPGFRSESGYRIIVGIFYDGPALFSLILQLPAEPNRLEQKPPIQSETHAVVTAGARVLVCL